jgi:uncharacterized phage protein gp47/JayE
MSLSPPTTQEISDTIVSQISASIEQSVPLLPKAFIRVLAKVLAGVTVLLWKYCGFIFLQLFVAYATDKPTTINGKVVQPLIEWGRLIGVGDPNPATQAELAISVVVKNQVGFLKARTSLSRPETGVIYETIADVALNAPTVPVRIRAVSDQSGGDGSGVIGNLQSGDIVEFLSPPPNVSTKAAVTAQAVTGEDAEQIEVYRARIIKRFQAAPQGGAYADYREWALEVPGIVNVYPYTSALPGVVDVYCEASVASSGSADGIPTAPQLSAVLASINLDVSGVATRRPANAAVRALAITRAAFVVTITGLTPDTADTRAAIKTGIAEYLATREPYIEGLSVLPKNNRITESAIAGIVDDIVSSQAASVVKVSLGSGPAYDLSNGEKAKLLGDPIYV